MNLVTQQQDDTIPDSDDLYAIMGIERTATQKQIIDVYRKLSMKHHPDRNGGKTSVYYLKIQKAYEILADKTKRAFYDATNRQPFNDNEIKHRAECLLVEKMNLVCSEICRSKLPENKMWRLDLIAFVSKTISEDKNQIKSWLTDCDSERKNYKKLIARFKKKTKKFEYTRLGLEFYQKISELDRQFHLRRVDIKIAERALELLKNYGYEFDEEETSPVSTATNSLYGGHLFRFPTV